MHNTDSGERLGSSLVYELDAPLTHTELNSLPDDVQFSDIEQHNLRVLKTVWLFQEESSHDLASTNDALTQDIVRLDHKMDVILALMGQLLSQQKKAPPIRRLKLGASSLEWLSIEPLSVGSMQRLELYLLPDLPMALELVGEVVHCEFRDGDYLISLSYRHCGEQVCTLLEKIIFREHRRQIARRHQRT